MLKQFGELEQRALAEIAQVASAVDLQQVMAAWLGRNGRLTTILKSLRDLPASDRATAGAAANGVRARVEAALEARKQVLFDAASRVPAGFDPTRPGIPVSQGRLHPITQLRYDLDDAFASLGFEIYDGPEISSELYEFDALAFPPDHPARESMDTFWLEGRDARSGAERHCLRPHLTGGSVRYMQEHTPPFRFVYSGRVYRNEATDASHERAFFQYEALIVERRFPFTAGRLLVNTILNTVFGHEVATRMRAGFFPFVEPGFEIDMQCLVCGGVGCAVCKQVGWLEVMPGGSPHPDVMRAGGIDPEAWEGFYINVGLDRLLMMQTGIDDVRLFHSGDLRFLDQF